MSDVPGYASASRNACTVWLIFAPKRHPRHIDVAVHVGEQAEILLRRRLAGRRELGHRAERRRLRLLAAGIGIDLRVEHEDVHVTLAGQDVVEAAVPDVVGPTVAAHQPDALLHQVVGERFEAARLGRIDAPPAPVAARAPARAAPGSPLPSIWSASSSSPARCRPPIGAAMLHQRARRASCGCPRRGAGRGRTPRCPRTANSTRPARGRRGWSCTAWSADCRRKSTSSPWRWRSERGRRRAA